jgi:hypothetical protein
MKEITVVEFDVFVRSGANAQERPEYVTSDHSRLHETSGNTVHVVKAVPLVEIGDLAIASTTIKMESKLAIFQMGLQENQGHPCKQKPRPLAQHVSAYRVKAGIKQCTDSFLDLCTQQRVAGRTAGHGVAPVIQWNQVGQYDLLVEEAVALQQPARNYMLVVERRFVASLATREAMASIADLFNESVRAEVCNGAVGSLYRAIRRPVQTCWECVSIHASEARQI